MRSLLLVVLLTLIVLLAITEAASPNIPIQEATKGLEPVLILPVRALSAEDSINKKRRLRGDSNIKTIEDMNVNGEERAMSLSSILDRAEAFLVRMETKVSPQTKKLKDNIEKNVMAWLYKLGETPTTLGAKLLGSDNSLVRKYRTWWEKVRPSVPK
ncbi:hypothetical protein PPTG_04451 [Phytophthora nicotianae INRA-310]|uniref:RxLR effector protein n=1 Tax=Phytophthora nicotianae (strain INRA-310) TaxID=761204 RepID=W2R2U6_PHYN3|nr:hypothetical protein PPTG_04451 [Phytophthora nicotianae INRA-310]ETN19034.1 hypothetical protein PPTG_04451 [Phytophthora nicotianae INRA-310]